LLRVGLLFDLLRQIQIVPADDGVFDQPLAPLGDLLFVLFGLGKGAGLTDRDGTPPDAEGYRAVISAVLD